MSDSIEELSREVNEIVMRSNETLKDALNFLAEMGYTEQVDIYIDNSVMDDIIYDELGENEQ